MWIHPVFSPDKLWRHANDPLLGQSEELLEPINLTGDNEWEIEAIVGSQLFQKKKLQYQICWKGFNKDMAWYPAQYAKSPPHTVQDYHAAYPDKPGPPLQLDEWLNAWEDIYEDDLPSLRANS